MASRSAFVQVVALYGKRQIRWLRSPSGQRAWGTAVTVTGEAARAGGALDLGNPANYRNSVAFGFIIWSSLTLHY